MLEGKYKGSTIVIIVLAIVYLLHIVIPNNYSNNPNRIINNDVISYYSYLPALFIEKDITLSFMDNDDSYWDHYWPFRTSDGKYCIKTTCGISILYLPFFGIGHLSAFLFGFEQDGFSYPYSYALLLSSAFYVICALIILRKFLYRYFSDKIVLLVLAILGGFSPLYWYTTYESPMSHAYSFFLFSAFLYLTVLWYEKPKWKYSLLLGIVIGVISLIRPTNILAALFFILYGVTSFKQFADRIKLFLCNYKKLLVMLFMVIAVWLPQLVYWKIATGSFICYSYQDESFFWSDPKILEVLFGFRKGFFIYSPILLCILPGFFFMWKKYREFFVGIILFAVLNVYVISSWWCWWYGGGFSIRPMIDSLPFMALPIAAFLEWVFDRKLVVRRICCFILLIFTLRSGFNIMKYHHHSIHYDSMTFEAYMDSFWLLDSSDEFNCKIEAPDYEEAKKGNR